LITMAPRQMAAGQGLRQAQNRHRPHGGGRFS
jgi:hypothetical protein